MLLREYSGRAAPLSSVALPLIILGVHLPLYQPWFVQLGNENDGAYLSEAPCTIASV